MLHKGQHEMSRKSRTHCWVNFGLQSSTSSGPGQRVAAANKKAPLEYTQQASQPASSPCLAEPYQPLVARESRPSLTAHRALALAAWMDGCLNGWMARQSYQFRQSLARLGVMRWRVESRGLLYISSPSTCLAGPGVSLAKGATPSRERWRLIWQPHGFSARYQDRPAVTCEGA